MIRYNKGTIEWLEFEQLQEFPELAHGVFLRHGGVSKAPHDTLNIGGGSGDDPEQILANRHILCAVLGIEKLVSGYQVHGKQIKSVSAKSPSMEESCDGLVTNEKNLGLLIKHADCQAAIFFDPLKKVVANIHCGWRGSVANIYAQTVEHFQMHYNSAAQDLLVSISPSLGPEKAEFIHYKKELPEAFLPFQVAPYYFDFWEISKMQLKKAGVLEHHIELAKICTFSEEKDFFSYRRDKKTGRHGTVVALKR